MSDQLYKIILIDDDPIVNFYNEDLLSGMQISTEILVFERAEEALLYLKEETAPSEKVKSLIFLDINMPGMNGFEFLRAYKSLDEINKVDIVVCMLTTSLNAHDKERVTSLEIVSSYISKPLDEQKVEDLLEQLENNNSFKVFDTTVLSGMPQDRKVKLLNLYTDLLQETIQIINKAKEEKDIDTIQFHAHKLKGSSNATGAKQLESIFSQLEEKAIGGELLVTDGLFDELNQEALEVLDYIKNYIE